MADNYKIADYLARAYEAEQEAVRAKDPVVAENWRRMAEDFRTLAGLMSTDHDDANTPSIGANPGAPMQRKQ